MLKKRCQSRMARACWGDRGSSCRNRLARSAVLNLFRRPLLWWTGMCKILIHKVEGVGENPRSKAPNGADSAVMGVHATHQTAETFLKEHVNVHQNRTEPVVRPTITSKSYSQAIVLSRIMPRHYWERTIKSARNSKLFRVWTWTLWRSLMRRWKSMGGELYSRSTMKSDGFQPYFWNALEN